MNCVFVFLVLGGLLLSFRLFEITYGTVLAWCLRHKAMFLSVPVVLLVLAGCIWIGFDKCFAFLPKTFGDGITKTRVWKDASEKFPGLGREFRPAFQDQRKRRLPLR